MKCECEDPGVGVGKTPEEGLYKIINTLKFDQKKCIGCGRCTQVCPHAVFEMGDGGSGTSGKRSKGSKAAGASKKRKARLVNRSACMECGACAKNCPAEAISVDSGVGCAAAMIWAALTGKKTAACGPTDDSSASCCGGQNGKKKGCC